MPTKTTKNIYQKLAAAKSEIGAISKDSTNPFFKSKYFDINGLIAHVEPILLKNGLLMLQPIKDGKVITQIIDIDTEQTIESEIVMTDERDPQKMGSQISYFRRYSCSSLLSIQSEDDDANSAKPKPAPVKPAMKIDSKEFIGALKFITEDGGTIDKIEAKYLLSPAIKKALNGSN